MLALTKKTEYAVIAACHLARSRGRVVSARDIAGQHGIRLPLLMGVLKKLNQRGLLRSVRGAHGGYVLAADPWDITLAGLIEAVEGPARLVRCGPPPGREACDLVGCCPVRQPMLKIHERFRAFLERVTIGELAWDEQFKVVGPSGGLRVLAP